MQFTVANSGASQRLSYLEIQGWKIVARTNNPPFGTGPAVMYENADGTQRAWFHSQEERKPADPYNSAVNIADRASRAEGDIATRELTMHMARTKGMGIDAMNQAWAFFEGIDLGPDRRSKEVQDVLSRDSR